MITELPEFSRDAPEALRQPLEDGMVHKDIGTPHVAEAIQYRSLDRKFWGS